MEQSLNNWNFRKRKYLGYGNSLMICGSTPALGEWQLDRAVPMQWTDWDNWEASLLVPDQF
jgi:hypothetical protein